MDALRPADNRPEMRATPAWTDRLIGRNEDCHAKDAKRAKVQKQKDCFATFASFA